MRTAWSSRNVDYHLGVGAFCKLDWGIDDETVPGQRSTDRNDRLKTVPFALR